MIFCYYLSNQIKIIIQDWLQNVFRGIFLFDLYHNATIVKNLNVKCLYKKYGKCSYFIILALQMRNGWPI